MWPRAMFNQQAHIMAEAPVERKEWNLPDYPLETLICCMRTYSPEISALLNDAKVLHLYTAIKANRRVNRDARNVCMITTSVHVFASNPSSHSIRQK